MFKLNAALAVTFMLAGLAPSIAQEPSPQSLTASQILTHMAATTAGLTSYKVPLHIDAHVKKGAVSVPVPLNGDRYFKAPDSVALKVSGVPAVAKAFSNTYASLGTPVTWQKTFDIALQSSGDVVDGHHVYTLRATYKRSSRVDHILLDVDTTTFDPVQGRWFYTNGATIVMHIEQTLVGGKYRLPSRETVDAAFPEYRGNAVVTYGTYATNIPIDASVFGG